MRDLELVIFDLAGTTIEDRGQVSGAITRALADHGIEVTDEQIKSVRGSSKRQALLELIPAGPQQKQLAARVYALFREHLIKKYKTEGVQAMPGAASAFQWL